MKKLTIIFYLFLIRYVFLHKMKSSMSHAKTVNDSTLIKIHAIVEDIDFRMHGLDSTNYIQQKISIIFCN